MNPYESQPDRAFWKRAIADISMFDVSGIWKPKFELKRDGLVATFGSCFAQHIGAALRSRGFAWMDEEPAPPHLGEANARAFNYRLFSARTGNIYTASLLLQWTRWALDRGAAVEEIWEGDGRFFDAFRPSVEPTGFGTRKELQDASVRTTQAFRRCIEHAHYFVFTLGLTESWFDLRNRAEYPMCPGTVAGEFEPTRHEFRNQSFQDVEESLLEAIRLMRTVNPDLRFILTVSPVPLTATNSGQHVLVASIGSKSVLRAVAGSIASSLSYVDYFPSFELVSSPTFRGVFFNANQRTISPFGVRFVMSHFFRAIGESAMGGASTGRDGALDPYCEEELLDAFGEGR